MPTDDGFERFWSVWPTNSNSYTRKGAKSECRKRWVCRHHHSQADQICKHVEWLKTTADWLKDGGAFIPAPLVYLNQQRWDGADIPISEAEKAVDREAVYRQQLDASVKAFERQRARNGGSK